MNWVLAWVTLVAGCGRLHFDARGDGGAGGDGVSLGTQRAFVKASNPDANDQFGLAIALSRDGSTLAVGAPLESSSARTIGGNQADNSALEMGAVYIFRRNGNSWVQGQYIKPANGDAGDQFGWSVALSADGQTLVVGARHESSNGMPTDNSLNNAGAAYVFVDNPVWMQAAYLKASNVAAQDQFGERVAVSDDGTTIAVSAPGQATNAGAVYVFQQNGATWPQQAYLKAQNPDAEDQFGYYISMSATGDALVAGAFRESSATASDPTNNALMYAGAAYVFTRAGTTWTQDAYLKASNPDQGDNFGYAVAMSADGTSAVISAPSESSKATGINGDPADNSVRYSGALYVFRGPSWTQQLYIKASNPDSNDEFGYCTAMAATGAAIVAGADGESSTAIDLDGDQTINTAASAGAGYLFTNDGGWAERHYIKASTTTANDHFGWSCSISGSGEVVAIGAPFQDDSATDSGGVYLLY